MRLLLLFCSLLTLGCAREAWHSPMAVAPDSAAVPSLALPSGGKWKFTGPVTVQLGTGNQSSTTDNTKAGQHGGSAATAPRANATASTKGGPPWWLYLLAAAAGAAVWEYFSPKLPLKWLPWRVSAP